MQHIFSIVPEPERRRCMDKKPYSLWKRRLNTGKTVYYVRFRLDNGSWGTAKSSGQTTKTAAEAWAIKYLKSGRVVLKENVTFSQFASDFFSPDSSYYKALSLVSVNFTPS